MQLGSPPLARQLLLMRLQRELGNGKRVNSYNSREFLTDVLYSTALQDKILPTCKVIRHDFANLAVSLSPVCATCRCYCLYSSYFCHACHSGYDWEGAGFSSDEVPEGHRKESTVYCALHMFEVDITSRHVDTNVPYHAIP
jgi:hypothetical protein